MPIDLTRLTPQELKNMLVNNARHNKTDTVISILSEMLARDMAVSQYYRFLKWSPDKVREIMQPFKEIASKVKGNSRVPYTDAGGLKIGRTKEAPDWKWIDSYSAIRIGDINAVFGCMIDRPGSEPTFRLRVNGGEAKIYNADGLAEALIEWHKVAQSCCPVEDEGD